MTGRSSRVPLFEFLTLDRLMTGPMTHLIYWGGLGVIALISFGIVGGAIGLLIRGGSLQSTLLSLPILVGGLLLCGVLALLWRGMCEFYMAVFRIADDLGALRDAIEREEAEARRHVEATAVAASPQVPVASPARQVAEG